MFKNNSRNGGLLLDTGSRYETFSAAASSGADVSWLSKCMVGDDQGQEGACAIFAMANWSEIMHGRKISDKECHEVYQATLKRVGRTEGGLYFSEAFEAANLAGWIRGKVLAKVHNLDQLINQPIVAGYTINAAWDNVSDEGCLDHSQADTPARGYHAVIIGARGSIDRVPGLPLVYIENSWGLDWGWSGIGVMTEALHMKLCREMWTIEEE